MTLDSLGGLGWERPFLGASLWVFMLGFMGMPLTGGLIGKFYVFSAAYEAGWWWLIVAGVIATAIALLLPRRDPGDLPAPRGGAASRDRGRLAPLDLPLQTAVLLAVGVTIGSFFFVQPLIDLARDAAASLPF